MTIKDLTQEQISLRVEDIVREHVGSDIALSPLTNLQDDLEIDSLELVELGITLEKEFAIGLPDSALRRCATLGDVTRLVHQAKPEHAEK
ncbi:MAG: acyl carrier protein [Ktedonobacteraceae bacterium]|nr:acyl carrier protein [Ktedonobacteraceae bacterium]